MTTSPGPGPRTPAAGVAGPAVAPARSLDEGHPHAGDLRADPLAGEAWPAPHAGGPLDALVDVPGSKSLTNRYLVLAALADGPGRLRGALRSRDTLLMAQALRSLGVRIEDDGSDWVISP